MRKLNTGDVFKMARLLKNANMVGSVKNAFEKGKEEGADEMKVGIDFVCDVLCACSEEKTETQLYDLLSGICEKKPEEIRSQSLETTVQDIQRIFEENNVLNFFRSASRLSGKIHG
ncbi:MAG TPA: hypothetical protein DCZ91_20310 [Lachnospiraceae bacterium]|nr:hypothetical protein [Lachnospiraceae bacterium]